MSNPAIKVKDLGKLFHIGKRENYRTLRDTLTNSLAAYLRTTRDILTGKKDATRNTGPDDYIWALKNVTFEVNFGEVLGIIGPNGGGKSTLLKILAKITTPTLGRVEIRGRMSSLLEVGTGFHPELTGRENIFLNGAVLGMKRREIERKFDEIVDFSEIDRFIDTPVKHYSSGMYLRLAFAVSAHLEPEILLVDEILAVGDASFQKKCLGKMNEVANSGRTVVFVSHDMAAVQQLTRSCLLLDHGDLIAQGSSEEVIHKYLNSSSIHSNNIYFVEKSPRRYPELPREVEFIKVELQDYPNQLIPADANLRLLFTVRGNETVDHFRFSLTIFLYDGTPVGNVFGPEIHSIRKGEVATFLMELSNLRLARGRYYCTLATGTGNHFQERVEFDIIVDVLYFEVMGPLRPDGVMSEWFTVWGPIRFNEPNVKRIA